VDWAGRYEALRQQTLDCRQAAGGWGLGLLIHRGIVAWMRACSVMTAEPSPARPTAEIPSSLFSESARPSPALAPAVAGQVACVLAQMILETRQEVLT
jgi:hypothetical protein